ncbi:MAG: two-component system, NtrC family, response regulator AtoC [Blastocatellia bacterium]
MRERSDDVIRLAEHYIAHFNERLRRRVRGLSLEVAEIFRHYNWPGNVRELRNVIERVMILEDSDLITPAYLPRGLTPDDKGTRASALAAQAARGESSPASFRLPAEGIVLDDLEMSLVRQALEHSAGNQTRAAELLGISRDQLRYRLKKLEEASGNAATR